MDTLSSELRIEAIDWFLECFWADEIDEEELTLLSDAEIIDALNRQFDGGFEAFKNA